MSQTESLRLQALSDEQAEWVYNIECGIEGKQRESFSEWSGRLHK